MPRFFVLAGRDLGQSFELASGDTLGRGADCAGRVRDPSVSRLHARLEERGGRWFVVDAGSRNGIFVNGQRVAESELADEAELVLGKVPLRVRLESEAADAAGGASPAPAGLPSSGPSGPGDGFVIEEEIELGPTRALPGGGPRSSPPGRMDPERPAPAVSERDLERARLLRPPARASLWNSDLAQLPLWMRAGFLLVAALLAALVFYAAFRAVEFLRST